MIRMREQPMLGKNIEQVFKGQDSGRWRYHDGSVHLGKGFPDIPGSTCPCGRGGKGDFLLGGAANVMNNIHSLGGKVSLCGVVGDDEMGQRYCRELTGIGIETRGIFVEQGRQTTVKTRIIATPHNSRSSGSIGRQRITRRISTFRNLSGFLKREYRGVDGIILSDYGKGLLTRRIDSNHDSEERGSCKKFVMVDPKLKNFFFYKGATVVTPNTAEASAASGVPITDLASLKRVGRMLLKRLGCDALVITQGEEGMAIFEPHQEPFLVPTVAKEVFDVTVQGIR